MQGKTKFFARHKGYGFVTGEDGTDYFVHQSDIRMDGYRALKKDQDVTFDVETADGKTKAVNVVPN